MLIDRYLNNVAERGLSDVAPFSEEKIAKIKEVIARFSAEEKRMEIIDVRALTESDLEPLGLSLWMFHKYQVFYGHEFIRLLKVVLELDQAKSRTSPTNQI